MGASEEVKNSNREGVKNIARIANAVQCHNQLSGENDCLNSGSQLTEVKNEGKK